MSESNGGPGGIRIFGGIVAFLGIGGQMMADRGPGVGLFEVSIGVTLLGVAIAIAGYLSENSSQDIDEL